MPSIPGTPKFAPQTELADSEDSARFASTHERAVPKLPPEFLAETNAIVLAETTYLRYTFKDKALIRAAIRPLSKAQTSLARVGFERLRLVVEHIANPPLQFPGSPDKRTYDELLSNVLHASTHYRLARRSGLRVLIIQYMESPRKYGLHGLDAVALANTLLACLGAVHIDRSRVHSGDTERELFELMKTLGFTDVVHEMVEAWDKHMKKRRSSARTSWSLEHKEVAKRQTQWPRGLEELDLITTAL